MGILVGGESDVVRRASVAFVADPPLFWRADAIFATFFEIKKTLTVAHTVRVFLPKLTRY